jgi:hypothetical protein
MRRALLALALVPALARAERVLVVVSDPPRSSTEEALEGFRSEWSVPVETASASEPLPRDSYDVIVAFGSRAAERARAKDAPLVIALAPAYRAYRAYRRGPPTVRVAMTPPPERFAEVLAAAGVRRLLAVRASPTDADFVRRAAEAGRRGGVVIEDRVIAAPENLPEVLRGAGLDADALWLAPDPGVVTAETFVAAREFARSRGIPFYAPAAGLVADEIRGGLTVSFRDCGREAARAARDLLAGRSVARIAYPAGALLEQVELSTHANASARP